MTCYAYLHRIFELLLNDRLIQLQTHSLQYNTLLPFLLIWERILLTEMLSKLLPSQLDYSIIIHFHKQNKQWTTDMRQRLNNKTFFSSNEFHEGKICPFRPTFITQTVLSHTRSYRVLQLRLWLFSLMLAKRSSDDFRIVQMSECFSIFVRMLYFLRTNCNCCKFCNN